MFRRFTRARARTNFYLLLHRGATTTNPLFCLLNAQHPPSLICLLDNRVQQGLRSALQAVPSLRTLLYEVGEQLQGGFGRKRIRNLIQSAARAAVLTEPPLTEMAGRGTVPHGRRGRRCVLLATCVWETVKCLHDKHQDGTFVRIRVKQVQSLLRDSEAPTFQTKWRRKESMIQCHSGALLGCTEKTSVLFVCCGVLVKHARYRSLAVISD